MSSDQELPEGFRRFRLDGPPRPGVVELSDADYFAQVKERRHFSSYDSPPPPLPPGSMSFHNVFGTNPSDDVSSITYLIVNTEDRVYMHEEVKSGVWYGLCNFAYYLRYNISGTQTTQIYHLKDEEVNKIKHLPPVLGLIPLLDDYQTKIDLDPTKYQQPVLVNEVYGYADTLNLAVAYKAGIECMRRNHVLNCFRVDTVKKTIDIALDLERIRFMTMNLFDFRRYLRCKKKEVTDYSLEFIRRPIHPTMNALFEMKDNQVYVLCDSKVTDMQKDNEPIEEHWNWMTFPDGERYHIIHLIEQLNWLSPKRGLNPYGDPSIPDAIHSPAFGPHDLTYVNVGCVLLDIPYKQIYQYKVTHGEPMIENQVNYLRATLKKEEVPDAPAGINLGRRMYYSEKKDGSEPRYFVKESDSNVKPVSFYLSDKKGNHQTKMRKLAIMYMNGIDNPRQVLEEQERRGRLHREERDLEMKDEDDEEEKQQNIGMSITVNKRRVGDDDLIWMD